MKLMLNGRQIEVSDQECQALLRNDLYSFIVRSFCELNPQTRFLHNWHIEKIAQALEEVRSGRTLRLIINMPPRSLKSHCASIAFAGWILGHNPSAQIICVSYGQELADNFAGLCRTLMSGSWYQGLFRTRLAQKKQAVHDFYTTKNGLRMATSVGGVLTGRGGDIIIIDDPLKPEEAASETQRKAVNEWYDHTLITRLNDKHKGTIVIIMQRLHEDDLVGHVLQQEGWKVLRFPAIAEEDETHVIHSLGRARTIIRKTGEALHPEREPLEVLNHIREAQGEYHFSGQYQQAPAPLGGGLVKTEWFKTYTAADVPAQFELIFQSWDSANKPTELSDYSVGTTWGVKDKHLYLLHVYRKRVGYPELKRAVREQADAFGAKTILIEDQASGTQLIQELVGEGMHAVKKYEPKMEKIMRMHSVTSTIENGFVHLPDKAPWLGDYLHELATFPNGKYDDQVDSTSQALDWFKTDSMNQTHGLIEYWKQEAQRNPDRQSAAVPQSKACSGCNGVMTQRIPGGLRCAQCGAQWLFPGVQPRVQYVTRADVLNRIGFR